MRKKIISLLIVSILCILTIAPSAFAAPAPSVNATSDRDTGKIAIAGDTGAARAEYVFVVIVDDDYAASDLTPDVFSDYAVSMGLVMSDDNGEFELDLRLNDTHLVTDWYRVIAFFTNGTSATKVFKYKSYYQIPYALRDMSGYAEADAAQFYGKYDLNDDVFADESEDVQVYYNSFDATEKSEWAKTMIKLRPEGGYIDGDWMSDNSKVDEGLEKFNKSFKQAELLTELVYNKATKEDADTFLKISETKTELGIDERYYTNKLSQNQAAEDVRLAVSEAIVNADPKPKTPAELNALIEETLAVEEFQHVNDMADCQTLIDSYNKVFAVSDTEEDSYATKLAALVEADEKASVIETMYANKAAGTSSFTTKANIIAAYEKAIAEEYANMSGGDGGSGDGGLGDAGSGDGGSGDGGGITIGGGGAITPDVDENKEKMTFTDLASYGWAKDAIYALVDDGVLSGFGDGTFRPSEKVTREQFVTMLVNRYQKAAKADITGFTDVKAGAWYYDYAAIGVGSGMVYGLSDTEFGVGKPITRQDLAVMAYRAMGSQYVAAGDVALGDIDSVADYARKAVEALYEMKIISGDENGNFRPQDNATRAEAARILYLLK